MAYPNFKKGLKMVSGPFGVKNTASVKSACAMWIMHVVQNYDNDILKELAVAKPLES
jgi:hypothetical protein